MYIISFRFYACNKIVSIDLSEQISSIEEATFYGCKSLINIDLTNVKSIGMSSFYNCIGLTKLYLPRANSIEENAFEGCINIKEISSSSYCAGNLVRQTRATIVTILTGYSIDDDMFSNCETLIELNLCNGIRSIGDNAFNGCKNSDTGFITVKKEDKSEYKIKPFKQTNGEREFLASSPAICVDENVFENLSVNTSYNYNLFLSWNFKGDADGFLIYAEHSDFPIYEINDNLQHYLTLYDYKGSTKFTIKAFINTLNGKVILAESPKVSLKIRKYKKPLVSLIVPAYNAQDYIIRSIDSALASDFSDLEIIIVNDGSTDDTQKIINWYAKNYSNVVSVEKENGGVADARNKGIEIAKGDYIAFMDNDDLIRPDMISKLYNTITKNKCDVAIAPLYRITDNGYTQHCKLPFIEDIPIDIDKYFEIMYTPGYYNCAIWNKLYKASMVKEHPLGKLKYEDVSWTPCILSYAENICFLKTPLYEWDRKTRPETFGDVLARQNEDDLFENRKEAMLFFIKNGNPDKRSYLRTIAKRRLNRYAKNSKNKSYQEMIDKIEAGKL